MNKTNLLSQKDKLSICHDIEDLILKSMNSLNRDGAVIGLSGGLDSAVTATLTVRSLGKDKVHLLNLPERDSKPIHKNHAKLLAKHLDIKLTTKSITPFLRALKTYKLLPLRFIPSRKLRSLAVKFGETKLISKKGKNILVSRLQPKANSLIAKGNAYAVTKHRMRMLAVYQYAEVRNLMVVGAANRTEWLSGTFSKWGVDHCADVMPLLHIYRSQLEELAEFIEIPDIIRNKLADPDVMPGINNKGELLGDFPVVDQILYAIENENDLTELINSYGKENVERILTLWEFSKHMRKSPYNLL